MNSNGFGFGLGLGMVVGYRNGFLARPLGHHTYVDVHSKENYNKRKDGYLECAVANTTVYVTNNINVQDVESQEDARLCNFWEDVCYGKLTIAEVNVTLSHGSIMDLIEIKIQKGCGSSSAFNSTKISSKMGNYNEERKCWTTSVQSEFATLTDTDGIVDGDWNIFDFSGTRGAKKELHLSGSITSNSKIQWQQEICVCDLGDRCNESHNSNAINLTLFAITSILSSCFYTHGLFLM